MRTTIQKLKPLTGAQIAAMDAAQAEVNKTVFAILNKSAKEKECLKYINSMRSHAKKIYADYYLSYKLNGGDEPDRGSLSYMGAQCVRMNIDKILEA